MLGALSASMVVAGSAHATGLGMVWAGWLQPLPTPEQPLTTFFLPTWNIYVWDRCKLGNCSPLLLVGCGKGGCEGEIGWNI